MKSTWSRPLPTVYSHTVHVWSPLEADHYPLCMAIPSCMKSTWSRPLPTLYGHTVHVWSPLEADHYPLCMAILSMYEVHLKQTVTHCVWPYHPCMKSTWSRLLPTVYGHTSIYEVHLKQTVTHFVWPYCPCIKSTWSRPLPAVYGHTVHVWSPLEADCYPLCMAILSMYEVHLKQTITHCVWPYHPCMKSTWSRPLPTLYGHTVHVWSPLEADHYPLCMAILPMYEVHLKQTVTHCAWPYHPCMKSTWSRLLPTVYGHTVHLWSPLEADRHPLCMAILSMYEVHLKQTITRYVWPYCPCIKSTWSRPLPTLYSHTIHVWSPLEADHYPLCMAIPSMYEVHLKQTVTRYVWQYCSCMKSTWSRPLPAMCGNTVHVWSPLEADHYPLCMAILSMYEVHLKWTITRYVWPYRPCMKFTWSRLLPTVYGHTVHVWSPLEADHYPLCMAIPSMYEVHLKRTLRLFVMSLSEMTFYKDMYAHNAGLLVNSLHFIFPNSKPSHSKRQTQHFVNLSRQSPIVFIPFVKIPVWQCQNITRQNTLTCIVHSLPILDFLMLHFKSR